MSSSLLIRIWTVIVQYDSSTVYMIELDLEDSIVKSCRTFIF